MSHPKTWNGSYYKMVMKYQFYIEEALAAACAAAAPVSLI